MGAPSSASTMARASRALKLAMPSCSRASSAITGGGSTSGLRLASVYCWLEYPGLTTVLKSGTFVADLDAGQELETALMK